MIRTEPHSSDEPASPVLAVRDIEKSYPGVRALEHVSFDCRAGEIHGLVGENGAGKSTLMRILAGVIHPEAGTILVKGKPVVLASPRQAHDLGIAMVYQDTRLVDDLDVAQNILLGREPGSLLLVNRHALDERARSILRRLGFPLDLRRPVRTLSTAERQIVEIGRVLATNPSVLILDEPTSALGRGDVQRLGEILRGLRASDTGIVFISHRLREVLNLADRITIMKDGKVVETVVNAELTEDYLVNRMVGRTLSLTFPPKQSIPGSVRLRVTNLTSPGRFSDVSFTVSSGEIVGLGGIQGNGQREIARALFGVLPATGEVQLEGVQLRRSSPRDAIRAGIVYVPADRRRESVFAPHSIRENISVPHLRAWSRFGALDLRLERALVAKTVSQFHVRTPSMEQPIGLLSGGNQQKAVFGRWILSQPKLYILEEPTQGIDTGAKLELYGVIRKLAEQGAAIVLLSADLLELIGLADSILVVAHGSIVDRVSAAEATEERIIGSAVATERAKETLDGGDGRSERESHSSSLAPLSVAKALGQRYTGAILLGGALLVLAAYTVSHSRYFFTERNLGNLVIQIVPLALASIGQMTVILLGGIDLSVGPLISLVTTIASFTIIAGPSGWVGILLCLVTGLFVGGMNSALIVWLRIPDLISTLATYSVVFGLALIVRPSPGGSVSEGFADFITMRLGWFPVAGFAILAISAIGEILLVKGRIGTRLYAIGSRSEAAFVAGIRVDRIRCFAYLFCGFMAALAGLVVAARIGSGDPQAGTQFTLSSIAAVVVGGTSVFGGRGTLAGTLCGATLLVMLQNALNQLHVTAYYQYIWTGALLLAAVALYSIDAARGR
jgi:ABC-type sugar transport system ATPase subunit/ribose/xylose/arabinose/galactoside ABC-type transport system permease subunit